MTDTNVETPRGDAGRFASSGEQLFGLAHEEHQAGFAPMPDRPKREEGENLPDTAEGVKEAARQLRERRAAESEIIDRGYKSNGGTGEPVDPKFTVTAERAAQDLANARAFEAQAGEVFDNALTAAEIDARRQELLRANPNLTKYIDGRDHLPEPEAKTEEAKPADTKPAEAKERSAEPKARTETVDGLDPELSRALEHPQVRQAIEQEIGKAHEVQQRADTALQTANYLGQSTFAVMFPEMLGGDPVAAFNQMAATNPQRAQACLQVLNAAAQVEAQHHQRQQQHAQYQAYQQQQQFHAYKAEQDKQLAELTRDIPPEAMTRYARAIPEAVGVDMATLMREAQSNPVLHHAGFQSLVIDGLRYRDAQKAKTAVTAKPMPPVQRPGTQQSRAPVSSNASKIQALEKQLATAPGHKQARIAAQIRQLRKAS